VSDGILSGGQHCGPDHSSAESLVALPRIAFETDASLMMQGLTASIFRLRQLCRSRTGDAGSVHDARSGVGLLTNANDQDIEWHGIGRVSSPDKVENARAAGPTR